MAGEVRTYGLLRAPDLVLLTVTAAGLTERVGAGGPELVAAGADAWLTVELPAQHIAETKASSGSSSSQARLAGPSRLRFQVDSQPISLSVSGILAAMARLLLTPGNQQAAGTLEIPWRVLLVVKPGTKCVHRSTPAASSSGVTELWHTRLVGASKDYVYPFGTLPLEPTFSDQTPLGGFFDKINSQSSSHPGQSMSVDRLTLSGAGAWFRGSISWSGPSGWLDWAHRAAMGRDFYVRVLESGVLFPFGHQAAYVETTEREFSSGGAAVAALRAIRSLVITEPTKEYDVAERQFPFQEVELAPLMVTELDQPTSATTFWPMRNGSPVLFSVHARVAQDVVSMALPLLFSAGGQQPEQLASMYAQGPHPGGTPSTPVGRSMAIAMKSKTEALDGAVQEVRSLTFGGKPVAGDVGFHPVVTALEVGLPAARQLLGQADSLLATFSSELLNSVPGGAPPDVLLQFAPRVLAFGSARAGVVAAPNMAVNQISRTLGPIVANLPTDPAQLFPGSATLLGIVPLRDLIQTVSGPPMITWSAGEHPMATLTWAQKLPKAVPPFAPTPGADCEVSLHVQATGDAAPGGGPPPVVTDGVIKNFTLNIPPNPDTLLELSFSELTFHAAPGALPKVTLSINTARFAGNLQFVQKLQECLPAAGNAVPAIEVYDRSIKATFVTALPTPPSLGEFVLKNLVFKAAVTLSLVNAPMIVEFAFASREQPFLVTVGGFGGGGYLELAIGAGGSDGGLQRFVGAIEFGACVAMDFGVAYGEVHVFGGVVFAQRGRSIEITGYLRIGGMVRVLGLISVSVELTIAMTYSPNVLTGSAKLVITVDLTFWSTSVEIGTTKTIAGSEAEPRHADRLGAAPRGEMFADVADASLLAAEGALSVRDALGPDTNSYPWRTYCQAFAQE